MLMLLVLGLRRLWCRIFNFNLSDFFLHSLLLRDFIPLVDRLRLLLLRRELRWKGNRDVDLIGSRG